MFKDINLRNELKKNAINDLMMQYDEDQNKNSNHNVAISGSILFL